ncbi:hypothetical protein Leryth_001671 [Lithospermum erythrorhizon]|nr:hypothetical protein Leryth_001671 [Lithospermum erythrorhizon]
MMMSGNNNNAAFETINAAATAIVTAENRVPQAASQKRRSFWSLYWCFGSVKGPKRIGHAAIIPDTTAARVNMAASDNPTQTTSIAIPFAAPPSSPDSFRPSEPPSSIQSPTGLLSLSSMAANMYSPRGPASMFTIGPFAYETQLVTPPAFSTYTTQPSTASYTPPPEPVHFTTPSSPEVPFARLLDPIHQNKEAGPGFPMSQHFYLLSSASLNYGPINPHFLEFRNVDHSKNLNLEKLYSRWESQQGSDTTVYNGWTNDETALDPRVSFEIASEVVRCAERKSDSMNKTTLPPSENLEQNIKEERKSQVANSGELSTSEHFTDGDDGRCHKRQRSITLSCAKEFNFDSIDGGTSDKSSSRSNWWANEKVLGQEVGTSKNWSFSPVIQSG